MTKYWVVGASWGGVEHQDQRFIEQGMWMLGWEDGKQPQRAAEMQPGDRIAIKRMKGKGQTGIRILHLGIIKGVILETNKVICTVNWVATHLDRDISESRGCFQSVHGPFEHDSPGFRKSSACERGANQTLQPTANPLRGLSAAELGR